MIKHFYSITNLVSGQHLGHYEADSEQEALDAMARDAGYADDAAMCRAVPRGPRKLDIELQSVLVAVPAPVALVPWREVRVNRIDGREPTSREHLDALATYRRDGAVADYVLCELPPDPTPEQIDAASEAGPEVIEIDWTGLDEEIAAESAAA